MQKIKLTRAEQSVEVYEQTVRTGRFMKVSLAVVAVVLLIAATIVF